MKVFQRLLGGILIFISIYVILTKPLSIVGEYPNLMGFLTILIIVASCLLIAYSYRNEKNELPSGSLAIVIIGPLAIIFGGVFNGISFENAKTSHLLKYGKVVKGFVTDKKHRSLSRKGSESNAYEIYFLYYTKERELIESWDVVSDKEFYATEKADSMLVIYSEKKPGIVDLIVLKDEKEIFKTKMIDFLDN